MKNQDQKKDIFSLIQVNFIAQKIKIKLNNNNNPNHRKGIFF